MTQAGRNGAARGERGRKPGERIPVRGRVRRARLAEPTLGELAQAVTYAGQPVGPPAAGRLLVAVPLSVWRLLEERAAVRGVSEDQVAAELLHRGLARDPRRDPVAGDVLRGEIVDHKNTTPVMRDLHVVRAAPGWVDYVPTLPGKQLAHETGKFRAARSNTLGAWRRMAVAWSLVVVQPASRTA